MDTKRIGIFLLHLRKEKGLTQNDIAKLCNVSTQAVSKWERGESVPDIELLNRLSDLYSVTINEIVKGESNEIHKEDDKSTNIVILSTSILVFLSYFFNFAVVKVYRTEWSWTEYIYKGYELIINGINGWQVYLTWTVFIILISHLMLNIFIVSKVVDRKGAIKKYLIVSSLIVIFVSLFALAHELFFVFPHFIIFALTTITFILTINSGKSANLLRQLKVFREHKKNDSIPSHLLLTDEVMKSKQMKFIKGTFILNMILFSLCLFYIGIGLITEIINKYQNDDFGFLIVITFIHLIITIVVINTYKFIGSIYTSLILKINLVLSVYLLIAIVGFLRLHFLLLLPILFIIITFIYGTMQFKDINKA